MAVEDLSDTAGKSLTYGSMCATNTISKPVAFQPPGSPSESVLGADVRAGNAAGPARRAGEHGRAWR